MLTWRAFAETVTYYTYVAIYVASVPFLREVHSSKIF